LHRVNLSGIASYYGLMQIGHIHVTFKTLDLSTYMLAFSVGLCILLNKYKPDVNLHFMK